MTGYLYFADVFGCRKMPDGKELAQVALKAVEDANMRAVKGLFETFPEHIHKTEYGDSVITLIIPLEQSHLSIHTWPAHKLACIDLFTCGDRLDAKRAINNLIEVFDGKAKRFTGFKRGNW